MGRLETEGKEFLYDGKPLRILSGAIHYFRVVPEYWRDRLLKLKACGLNTVETYIPWNFHEEKEGQFNFEGILDVCRFIEIAEELGIFVIVRPSPFICAEWEFGGLPAWLLEKGDIQLRCFDEYYLEKIDAYYDVLIEKLKPYLSTKGGPIIAMQVENEYGSYGNDKKYLNYLKEALIKRGVDVLLFTSDGSEDLMLQGGTLPDVLKTINFGSKPKENFNNLLNHQPDKPLMCMEYWNGWFDHWEEVHHSRAAKEVAADIDAMLEMGANFNIYMFQGGTNFGFYNGANHSDIYEPTVTSYDYDALLTENGEPTEKFYRVREVILKHYPENNNEMPPAIPKKAYGKVKLKSEGQLFKNLNNISKASERPCPTSMEKLGQQYGFILYRTILNSTIGENCLSIMGLHDRAQVFLNGEYKGTLYRNNEKEKIKLGTIEDGAILDILVENMGRVNYGPYLKDMKGILGGVRLDYQFIHGWQIYTLPLDNIEKVEYKEIQHMKGPSFYKGTLIVDELGDTFIELKGWIKGVVFINGFNIGRYWEKGPQRRLYVPAPLLKKGENEIVIFELYKAEEVEVEFYNTPSL